MGSFNSTGKGMWKQHYDKEGSLLLPSIRVAVLAGVCVLLWSTYMMRDTWDLVFSLFGLGLMMSHVVMSQFGSELDFQCLRWGITQPLSRLQFWRQKLVFSLPGYLSFGVFLGFILWVYHSMHQDDLSISQNELTLCLIGVCCVCFGPGIYLTFRLRNLILSLWLTCLIPTLLVIVFASVLSGYGLEGGQVVRILFWGSVAYGLLGLWLAKRAFMNWEDLGDEAHSKTNLLERRKAPRSVTGTYQYRPLWAMFLRELNIQKVNLVFCFVALILYSILAIAEKHLSNQIGEAGTLNQFFRYANVIIGCLLYLVPCSTACVSIAESRKWDVHIGELVAPVSRNLQFIIKLLVAFMIGGLLALYLPLWINITIKGEVLNSSAVFWQMVGYPLVYGTFLFSICFYASSMADSFLKSFTYALITLPALALLVQVLGDWLEPRQTASVLFMFLILLSMLLYLSKYNFLISNFGIWNLPNQLKKFLFGIFILFITLPAIEHRAWEYITLTEPAKEISVLKQDVQPTINLERIDKPICLAPNGTLWRVDEPELVEQKYAVDQVFDVYKLQFEAEVNYWTQLVSSLQFRFALDAHQKLWMWKVSDESPSATVEAQQLGTNHQWKKISAAENRLIALATDGTLWVNKLGEKPLLEQEVSEFEMVQIDEKLPKLVPSIDEDHSENLPVPKSDWVDCLAFQGINLALNVSGQLFAWGSVDEHHWAYDLQLSDGVMRPIYSGNRKFVSIKGKSGSNLILQTEDGHQWIPTKSANLHKEAARYLRGDHKSALLKTALLRLNIDQPILQCISRELPLSSNRLILIKQNGTLNWQWSLGTRNFNSNPPVSIFDGVYVDFSKLEQVGMRDDWVAIAGRLGMTADGKIWNWDTQNRHFMSLFPPRTRHKVVADLDP